MWMSSLPQNSNILDIDAIENHIGPKGLKIIDFGLWTSQADQNDAIDRAVTHMTFIRPEGAKSEVPANPAGTPNQDTQLILDCPVSRAPEPGTGCGRGGL